MVSFEGSEMEQMVRSAVCDIVDNYDRDYWREVYENKRFPEEVWEAFAENGWIGMMVPEEYGGQGLGLQEFVWMIEEVGRSPAWAFTSELMSTGVFGGETIKKHGTEEQRQEWLPRIVDGDAHWALGVTEPEAGLNTTNTKTTAEKNGDEYVIDGQKTWTSGVDWADKVVVLARTAPAAGGSGSAHGLSIFFVDPDDPNVTYDEIPLDIFVLDRTFNFYLDDVRVDHSQLVGDEHRGLYQIFDILNAERITIAAGIVASGFYSLDIAVEYANEREVFDAPIGSHQAIQHPLADAYAELKCAELYVRKAAWVYENDREALPTAANVAGLQAGKAAWNACEAAMTTFGGMSASAELPLAKIWSRVRHMRIAPVSEQMIWNYIAEHELDFPRSY